MVFCNRLLAAALATLIIALPAQADTLTVRIGYLHWIPDQGPVLSNVIPAPEDSGLRGADLAIADNRTTGKFLGQNYLLEQRISDSQADTVAAFESLQKAGIDLFVVNAPASALTALVNAADEHTLLMNAGAKDDDLRTDECHPNLVHTIPSYSMLTDALGQWLNQRRWQQVFMITGPTDEDQAWAQAFRRSAKRFGLDLVADKPWTFDTDLRRMASKELPVFTQHGDYDAVVVADVHGDFGEYVPFNTWLPRPVVGTQGMSPVAWHRVVESWGAAQLQKRFSDLADRNMNNEDYAAWAAVRSIGTAVTQLGEADPTSIRNFLLGDQFQLAGFKGRKLTYRSWNGQLRQPIPLVHPRGLVAQAPFDGYLHPNSQMDTLGFDEPESTCRISG